MVKCSNRNRGACSRFCTADEHLGYYSIHLQYGLRLFGVAVQFRPLLGDQCCYGIRLVVLCELNQKIVMIEQRYIPNRTGIIKRAARPGPRVGAMGAHPLL